MKNQTEEFEMVLCPAAVDECSEKIRNFLSAHKIARPDIIRYSMTAEEILLGAAESIPEGTAFCLRMGKKFSAYFITLEFPGERCNIFTKAAPEQGVLGRSILSSLGLTPDYTYKSGSNFYSLRVKRKTLNPIVSLLLVEAVALLIGALGFLFPASVRTVLLTELLTPVSDAFLDLLNCIAGPMIFLSVAWGIYGIGDAATLKNTGKKLCGGYIGTTGLLSLLLCLPMISLFHLHFSSGEALGSSASATLKIVLGIIPRNIFSPFVDGNTLQIIFLAVSVGIAMIFLAQKTMFVAELIEQINHIIHFLIGLICKLVPGFISIVLLRLMWSDVAGSLSGIGKMLILFISATLISTALLLGYTGLKNKISPLRLIRKGLSTFIVAFTTASSAAAFGTNMNNAHREYGIDEKLCSFGVPLGIVTYKSTSSLNYIIQCMFFAELYSVDVSVSWIAVLFLSSIVLAIATPPIPGGGLASYAVLFAQLGIPTEALAVALVCDTVFDFIITGFDQFGLDLVLLNQATNLGFVNRKGLMDEESGKR